MTKCLRALVSEGKVTEGQPTVFAVALQFEQTESVLSATVELGKPFRLRLPQRTQWPDGSWSEFLEIVIDLVAIRGAPLSP